MNQKTYTAAGLMVCVLMAMAMPSMMADSNDVTTSVQVGAFEPSIETVVIEDDSGMTQSSLDVNREYYVVASFVEKNGLQDLDYVSVDLYFSGNGTIEPSTHDKRCNYTLTWSKATGDWTSQPAGYINPSNSSIVATAPSVIEATFAFSLDKVAMPSGMQNAWTAGVTVCDSYGLLNTDLTTSFDVNDYIEWSGLPSSVALGSSELVPEESWTLDAPIVVTPTITANTHITVSFEATDLVNGDASIDASSYISAQAATTPAGGTVAAGYDTPQPVPESTTPFFEDVYATACTLDPSVSGYTDNDDTMISFSVDILQGSTVPCLPAGTYAGACTFTFERGSGSTA
ncbi:MAG TPA: hypothetical protein ENN11_05605 [Methanomicrobia archaeon]|nr:hypothetical protein [Methanomicrobia archaeon]